MSSTLVATGVGSGVATGVATGVGLLATGGVGCPRSHPQTTTTTKQTAADLKRLTLAPVVKGFQASDKHKQKPRRSGKSDGTGLQLVEYVLRRHFDWSIPKLVRRCLQDAAQAGRMRCWGRPWKHVAELLLLLRRLDFGRLLSEKISNVVEDGCQV